MCKFFWPSRNSGQLLHTCRNEPYLCRCDSDGYSSASAMRSDEDSLRSLWGPSEARKWSPVEIRLSNLTPSSTAYKWSADSTSALALRKNNHGTYYANRCHQGHLRKVWQRQQRLLRYQHQFKPHPPREVPEQAYRSRHRATGSTDEGFRYPAEDGADILQSFSR